MVAALPRNIQLKLRQTLNQWRQWRCDPPLQRVPQAVSLFSTGISNYSILVEAETEAHYVVRIDGVDAINNTLSRSSEWRVLQVAHEAHLAPCPRYYNPELGVLVCDYLPSDIGHTYCAISDTAALLHRIHQLPAIHHRLDLRERFVRYEKQLQHQCRDIPTTLSNNRELVLALLSELHDQDESSVLCHNDLLAANRISSGKRLWALDWEYTAMGSFWFDLAVVAIGDHLQTAQKQELVTAYLGRNATLEESKVFSRHCLVYQYLEILWYMANTSQDTEQHLRRLQQAINRENY